MAGKNQNQSWYQDDDMDTGMNTTEDSDMGVDTGEKGGQATRDQSNTQDTENISGMRDEDIETDLGSDF